MEIEWKLKLFFKWKYHWSAALIFGPCKEPQSLGRLGSKEPQSVGAKPMY